MACGTVVARVAVRGAVERREAWAGAPAASVSAVVRVVCRDRIVWSRREAIRSCTDPHGACTVVTRVAVRGAVVDG